MERQQQMNTLGAQAMKHWQRWLPNRYSAIEDPQGFFTDLGEQVQNLITDGCLEWEHRERDQLNSLDYLERVGRLNAIRHSVTESVLSDLVLLDPEPEMLEEDLPVSEAPTLMRADGMPVDPHHPLHRMEEDPDVSRETYRAALQEFWTEVKAQNEDSTLR